MEVFIKDVIKLGGRKLMIWTIPLIVGCIQYALAVTPTDVKISDLVTAPTGTVTEVTGTTLKTWKVDVSGGTAVDVVLTCEATGGDQYLFFRNRMLVSGQTIGDTWGAVNITIPLDEKTAGMYTCRARDGSTLMNSDSSPAVRLTLDCTPGLSSDSCTQEDMFAECDNTNSYCKCKLAKTSPSIPGFPQCVECDNHSDCAASAASNQPRCSDTMCMACGSLTHTNAGCDADGVKPRCDGTTGECKPCNATDNAGCDPYRGGKPRCDGSTGACTACDATFCKDPKPQCDTDSDSVDFGKCVAKTSTSATEATDSGSTNSDSTKASPVTSSAGTVTSTVSVVIASVVVALMN